MKSLTFIKKAVSFLGTYKRRAENMTSNILDKAGDLQALKLARDTSDPHMALELLKPLACAAREIMREGGLPTDPQIDAMGMIETINNRLARQKIRAIRR